MSLLEEIENRLAPVVPTGQQLSLGIPVRWWGKERILIAGSTHLPIEEQMMAWGRSKGWHCHFDPQSLSVTFNKLGPRR